MTNDYREVDHDALEAILRDVEAGEFVDTACRAHGIKPGRLRAWMKADETLAERLKDAFESGQEAIALRARKTMRGMSTEFGGDSTGDTVRDKAIVELDLKLLAFYDKRWNPKMEVQHGGKIELTHEEFLRRVADEAAKG